MRFDWRATSGPALTTATALIAAFAHHRLSFTADPAPLFVCVVACASSLSGTLSGLISALIAVGASALFFNNDTTSGHDAAELAQLSLLAVTTAGTAVIVGLLRKRLMDAFTWERRHHALAERLSAALDHVDFGIVLLDSDTRAEFINRAFRDYFALADKKADSKPPFIALMYHGRDTGAYEMPKDELSAFIAQRTEMMRVGDSTPINIKLKDGKVLRFSCTALPDGGRMLSYMRVPDLVPPPADPADLEYYLSLRGTGVSGSTRRVRAAE